jgi:curved DNA-binding protein CbpA
MKLKFILFAFSLSTAFCVEGMYLFQKSARAIQDYFKKITAPAKQVEQKKEVEQQESVVKAEGQRAIKEEQEKVAQAEKGEDDQKRRVKDTEPVYIGPIEPSEEVVQAKEEPTPQVCPPSTSGSTFVGSSSASTVTPLPPLDPNASYYEILGVLPNATQEEIKKAYREKIRLYRGSDKDLQIINQAYDTLKDGARRKQYDKVGISSVQEYEQSLGQQSLLTGNIDTILAQLEDVLQIPAYEQFFTLLADHLRADVPGNFLSGMVQLFDLNMQQEFSQYASRFERLIRSLPAKYGMLPVKQYAEQYVQQLNFMSAQPDAYRRFFEQQRSAEIQRLAQMYQQAVTTAMLNNFQQYLDILILNTEYIIAHKQPYYVFNQQLLLDEVLTIAKRYPAFYFYIMRLYALKAQLYFEHKFFSDVLRVIEEAEKVYEQLKIQGRPYGFLFNDPSTENAVKQLKAYKILPEKIRKIEKLTQKLEKVSKLNDDDKLEKVAKKISKHYATIALLFDLAKVRVPADFNMSFLANAPIAYLIRIAKKLNEIALQEEDMQDKEDYKGLAQTLLNLAGRIAEKVNDKSLIQQVKNESKLIRKSQV